MDSLWDEVSVCFDTDDGSLPGIEIDRLSPSGVSAIYGMLRNRSRVHGRPPEVWLIERNASVLVDSVPDAARLVATGEAEAFHHCVERIVVRDIELPVLGVFVWSSSIELDYRMGNQWRPPTVRAFFELLRECCSLDPGAVVIPADVEGPPYPERFHRAWTMYNQSMIG